MTSYGDYSNALASLEGIKADIQRLRAEGKPISQELEYALFNARMTLTMTHKSYLADNRPKPEPHLIRRMTPSGEVQTFE
jgi:hypothetical protein